jgi:hypothetical protein
MKEPSEDFTAEGEIVEEESSFEIVHSFLKEYLPEAEIVRLLSLGKEEKRKEGEVVIVEKTSSEKFGILLSGELAVEATIEGKSYLVGHLTSPSLFGEVGVLQNLPRTATIKTKTPAWLIFFPGEELKNLTRKYPKFKTFLENLIHERLEKTLKAVRQPSP